MLPVRVYFGMYEFFPFVRVSAGLMRDALAEKEQELEAERAAHMDALGASRKTRLRPVLSASIKSPQRLISRVINWVSPLRLSPPPRPAPVSACPPTDALDKAREAAAAVRTEGSSARSDRARASAQLLEAQRAAGAMCFFCLTALRVISGGVGSLSWPPSPLSSH